MAVKRKSISKGSRFEIFKRDCFQCQYCGRTPPVVILHIDHVTPVSKGGDNDPLNLVTACLDCNLGKSDRTLTSVPPPLKSQLEEQKIRREQIEQYNEFLMGIREKQSEDIKELGRFWHEKFLKGSFIFAGSRVPSVKKFLTLLPKAEILDAMDASHGRLPVTYGNDDRTFIYFCGICWRKIKAASNV